MLTAWKERDHATENNGADSPTSPPAVPRLLTTQVNTDTARCGEILAPGLLVSLGKNEDETSAFCGRRGHSVSCVSHNTLHRI